MKLGRCPWIIIVQPLCSHDLKNNYNVGVKNMLPYFHQCMGDCGAPHVAKAGRDFRMVHSLILCRPLNFHLKLSSMRSSLYGLQGQTNLVACSATI